MRTVLKNYSKNTETIYNFENFVCTVYLDNSKYMTKKYQNIDELLDAVRTNVEVCEKKGFQFSLLNN